MAEREPSLAVSVLRLFGLLALVPVLGAVLAAMVFGGLMATGALLHERRAAAMEHDLRNQTWPEGVTVVASGHAVNGPMSSNSCVLEAVVVLDGVSVPLPSDLHVVSGPLDYVDRVERLGLSRLEKAYPPEPGRRYASVTEYDASSFAFRWNLACH